MSIERIHTEIHRARPVLRPIKLKDGYAYWLGGHRAIRISHRASPGTIYLVKAASGRAKLPETRGPFTGTVAELLAILDGEIALIQSALPQQARPRTR